MALLLATKKGDITLVKEMLEVLAVEEVNIATADKKETALHIAAQYGHTEIAEMLLACPRFVTVDALDSDYNTALHSAALKGRDSVVRLLLASERFRGGESAECLRADCPTLCSRAGQRRCGKVVAIAWALQ